MRGFYQAQLVLGKLQLLGYLLFIPADVI